MVVPNRVFGEQVLVAAGMSDKWPEKREGQVALYQSAFPAFAGVMCVRPLGSSKFDRTSCTPELNYLLLLLLRLKVCVLVQFCLCMKENM
ncbi:hypothetical protein Hanom_Chr02g00107141 [Helianthus anomalus]